MNQIEASKVHAELNFWRDLCAQPDFVHIRQKDYYDKAKWLPELHSEHGIGLDLACGPLSIFDDFTASGQALWQSGGRGPVTIYAADRLLNEYLKMFSPAGFVKYVELDMEDLSNGFGNASLDWVCCFNAIDHTPNPGTALDEIKRILKPGGRLYLNVHFDPELYAPHYKLWSYEEVWAEVDSRFKLLRSTVEWHPEWGKYTYWGLYVKQ